MKKLLIVERAKRFSPLKTDMDKAILDEIEYQASNIFQIKRIPEDDIDMSVDADIILSMGRAEHTLILLENLITTKNINIINTPSSIRACKRSKIKEVIKKLGIDTAPDNEENGFWVKRGDSAVATKDEIRYCIDEKEKDNYILELKNKGITDIVVEAHVIGSLIKFYCIGNNFLHYYYTDKSDLNKYSFDVQKLHNDLQNISKEIGIKIFGGDLIVNGQGIYHIIDFNDFPSFSICKSDAAKEIISLIQRTQ